MIELYEELKAITAALEAANVAYALVGGLAVSLYAASGHEGHRPSHLPLLLAEQAAELQILAERIQLPASPGLPGAWVVTRDGLRQLKLLRRSARTKQTLRRWRRKEMGEQWTAAGIERTLREVSQLRALALRLPRLSTPRRSRLEAEFHGFAAGRTQTCSPEALGVWARGALAERGPRPHPDVSARYPGPSPPCHTFLNLARAATAGHQQKRRRISPKSRPPPHHGAGSLLG